MFLIKQDENVWGSFSNEVSGIGGHFYNTPFCFLEIFKFGKEIWQQFLWWASFVNLRYEKLESAVLQICLKMFDTNKSAK